jgi:hypothetical protein
MVLVPLDLPRVRAELAENALVSPYPPELAIAIVADVFRLAGQRPLSNGEWDALRRNAGKRLDGQLGMLAHALALTSLRAASVEALVASRAPMAGALADFVREIAPLEPEMIRANAFRQEELLRWWMRALGGAIAGEAPAESAARLDKLDYKKALAEYEVAEKARAKEAEARAKALREAAEREAEARGWRE